MLKDLGVIPLCEGIETVGELSVVRDLGVDLVQGYLLAKPAFEALALPASFRDAIDGTVPPLALAV